MTEFQAVARSDVGRRRDHNEDFALETGLRGGAHLLVVADGMGGHAAGEVASATGLKAFHDRLSEGFAAGSDERPTGVLLREAVEAANGAVLDAAAGNPHAEGMGTTLVGALVSRGEAVVVNVGDSRAYLLDGPAGGVDRITRDHSLVNELLAEGAISADQAEDHPKGHVLSQALGVSEGIDPDLFPVALDGGTLLLCSDGLTGELDEDEIGGLVAEHDDLAGAAEALIDRANERGGSDNVSVVLGRWG